MVHKEGDKRHGDYLVWWKGRYRVIQEQLQLSKRELQRWWNQGYLFVWVCLGGVGTLFFFKCQTKEEWSTDCPLEDLGWNFGGCREGKGGRKVVQQVRLPGEASPSLEGFKAQPARPWLIWWSIVSGHAESSRLDKISRNLLQLTLPSFYKNSTQCLQKCHAQLHTQEPQPVLILVHNQNYRAKKVKKTKPTNMGSITQAE